LALGDRCDRRLRWGPWPDRLDKVGSDIAAGSYKTSGPSGTLGHCYWARLKDDSGNGIIANDITSGPTRFTAKTGEYVQITGCDFTRS
jgi:hypothetical protein